MKIKSAFLALILMFTVSLVQSNNNQSSMPELNECLGAKIHCGSNAFNQWVNYHQQKNTLTDKEKDELWRKFQEARQQYYDESTPEAVHLGMFATGMWILQKGLKAPSVARRALLYVAVPYTFCGGMFNKLLGDMPEEKKRNIKNYNLKFQELASTVTQKVTTQVEEKEKELKEKYEKWSSKLTATNEEKLKAAQDEINKIKELQVKNKKEYEDDINDCHQLEKLFIDLKKTAPHLAEKWTESLQEAYKKAEKQKKRGEKVEGDEPANWWTKHISPKLTKDYWSNS